MPRRESIQHQANVYGKRMAFATAFVYGRNGVLLREDIKRLFEHACRVENKRDLMRMPIHRAKRVPTVFRS